MTITRHERSQLDHALVGMKQVLPVEEVKVDELQAVKGLSFRRPTLLQCVLTLNDAQFTHLGFQYFPKDWAWGEPQQLLQGRLFLYKLPIRNPVPSLTKGAFFGEATIYAVRGNYEVKQKTGFMRSRVVGYRFKAVGNNSENRALVTKINADRALLAALHKEFAVTKRRPLPDVLVSDAALSPLGGFDVFDIDRHKAKVAETDFWYVEDPHLVAQVVRRLAVLRPLAIYLQGTTPSITQPIAPPSFCTLCGSHLPNEAVFCGQCGHRLSQVASG